MRTLFLFLCLLTLANAADARETITLVADEWCPYNCGEKDVKPGYMVELAREALAKVDIDVRYKVMPWEDAVTAARAGKYAGIIGANRGDAPDFVFPETIQGISINQAWVRKDKEWVYERPSSLDNERLAIIAGYAYGKTLDPQLHRLQKNNPRQIMIARTPSATDENIDALRTGNVDVIFEDKSVVAYYFASRGLQMDIKSAGNPVDVRDYDDTYIFVAFSPKLADAPRYAKLLVAGMKEMEENGELAALLARYNMDRNYRFPAEHARH